MHPRVDEERRRLDRVFALEHVAVRVAQHQRGGGDLRPVPAIGVDQEPVAAHHAVLAGHRQREVVADALVQTEPRRPAQRAGEIDPLLLKNLAHLDSLTADLTSNACHATCQPFGHGARLSDNNAGEANRWEMARAAWSPSLVADAPLLRFAQVSKRFGGTVAVNRVSLDLHAGEILALLGENGAGKSTLIKLLAGIHTPDEGQILVHGQHYQHRPAVAGERQTIAFIHQDLGLIEWMTVTENMAMGLGYPRSLGLINWRQAERRAREALAAIGGAHRSGRAGGQPHAHREVPGRDRTGTRGRGRDHRAGRAHREPAE